MSTAAIISICTALVLFGIMFIIGYVSYQLSVIDEERDI